VISYRFNSLEDFLISTNLTVDAQLDDGWGAKFPVKGREIEATILFADIADFSGRTLDLSPTETLIFVNNFFAWITAEALRNRPGIVDKYIGDEIMVVFSKEFGSEDPFVDAVQAARWMGENDYLAFCPHIGIASGKVVVGYVGTPIKYNCSVFGKAVTMASRCAGVRPQMHEGDYCSGTIVFPACEWGNRDFGSVFPPRKYEHPKAGTVEQPTPWELLLPRSTSLKNIGDVEVRELVKTTVCLPSLSAENRACLALHGLKEAERYRPTE
jgi:class 3 adenylate cyclase